MASTSSKSSLCHSYRQVDAFGPDDMYEDEEVSYITLDLGNIEPTLVPSSSTYRLIGLDTPTPFLQLSGTILKGSHETLLGTELIFTEGKGAKTLPESTSSHIPTSTGSHDTHKKGLAHVANTEQRICFKEVGLQLKGLQPRHGQGKSKAKAGEQMSTGELEPDAASQMVDRVTGKNAPRAKAPRLKNPKQTEKEQTKGKAKETTEDQTTPPEDSDEEMYI